MRAIRCLAVKLVQGCACAAVVLANGCTTMKGIEETGNAFSRGDVFTGLYYGTIGLAVAGIYDVVTLGGALTDDQVATAGVSAVGASAGGKSLSTAYLQQAKNQLGTSDKDTARASSDRVPMSTQTASSVDVKTGAGLTPQESADLDRMAASPNGCPSSLGYLDSRLPRYNHKLVMQARSAVVSESVPQVLARIRAQGYTPAAGAAQLFERARAMKAQLPAHAQCIRNTSTQPEKDIRDLEEGRFVFTDDHIRDNCAGLYVVQYLGAIGMKETALAVACHATRL